MEQAIVTSIESQLNAMTTDDYSWTDSYERHDRTGTLVEYCCKHENGWYGYTKNIDKGRRTVERVQVGKAWFTRVYGQRNKHWVGYVRLFDENSIAGVEDYRLHITEGMKNALDRIADIHR